MYISVNYFSYQSVDCISGQFLNPKVGIKSKSKISKAIRYEISKFLGTLKIVDESNLTKDLKHLIMS